MSKKDINKPRPSLLAEFFREIKAKKNIENPDYTKAETKNESHGE